MTGPDLEPPPPPVSEPAVVPPAESSATEKLGLGRSILLTLGGLTLAVIVGWLGLTRLLRGEWPWQIGGLDEQTSGQDIIKLVLTVVAGIGAAAALVVAYRRQRTLEAQHKQDQQKETRRQKELDLANQRADDAAYRARFIEAAAQLGNDNAAVRLAGGFAMAQLADDWHASDARARQQCIDVLCAYVRMPVRHTGRDMEGQAQREIRVRATLVRVIADHFRGSPARWAGVALDFTGGIFPVGGSTTSLGAISRPHR